MPSIPKSLCNTDKQYDKLRGSSSSRGYDRQWQLFRISYLNRFPLCRTCKDKGLIKQATLIHHIVPLNSGGAKYEYSNLMPLCQRCHEDIHGAQRFKHTL